MRKFIIAGLMAAVTIPATAASAQSWQVREERQDLREERRELQRAQRNGSNRDIREERREVREARQDYRQAQRYNAGRYTAPRGYAFRPANRGNRLNRVFFSGNYVIGQPSRYGLVAPRYSYTRWVRHGADVLLVDTRSGVVIQVVRNRFW